MNVAVVLAALLGGLSIAVIVLSVYHGVRANGERQEEILERLSEIERLLKGWQGDSDPEGPG